MPVSSISRVASRYLEAVRLPTLPSRSLYIPSHLRGGERAVDPEGTDLAIWTWEDTGKLYGVAFQGKSNKPLWYYGLKTEAARQRKVEETIADRKSQLKFKEERLQERKNFQHDIKVGDIFYTSWGYDQTNVNFYEVVALKDKAVVVREVASKTVREDRGVNYVVAVPKAYVGPPMTKIPQRGNYLKIGDQHAQRWDGKPKYETAFGFGH